MTRHQYFRDSVGDNEHEYDMQGFARFHARLLGGNGISNTQNDNNIEPYDDFEVKATSGMDIELGSGYAAANGFMLEEDTPQTMTLDTSDPDHDRIDRVVIRFDTMPEKAEFKPVILKGKPDKNPTPPDLTRDNYTYELYVAQIRVRADKASLDNDDITDERNINRLPIDNLQRGVRVDEHGMVYMPNQSYVEMVDNTDLKLKGDDSVTYVSTEIPIRPDIDKQKEVSNGVFTAKSNGVYQFYVHLALERGGSLGDRQKIELFLVVNDNDNIDNRVYLFNQPGTGYSDLHFMGSGIKYLEKGDKVNVIVATRSTGNITSRYRRMSIAKLN